MPYYPILEESGTQTKVIGTFRGYNHALKVSDGEFYDMKNLCSDYFPLLGSRAKRGDVRTLTAPKGMLAKAKLAYIDGTSLYYDGLDVTSHLTAAGVSIGFDSGARQMVSMGAYIVIFPDKIYFNTEDFEDCGSLDAEFTLTASTENKVFFYLCREDGTTFPTPTASSTAPASPADGDTWYAPSETDGLTMQNRHALKQYNADSGFWNTISTIYVKICAAGIGAKFDALDGVALSGFASGTILDADGDVVIGQSVSCPQYGGGGNQGTVTHDLTQAELFPDVADLNGEKVIYKRGDNFIMVKGTANHAHSQAGGTIAITRTMPDLDFVTEAQNRLWGCKFGVVNGESINEIYASALGNFKNWRQFQGISTDSYAASVGTDGPWTGAITHLGYPLFFKENHMHKVFVSASGAHQIDDKACRGVQSGSSRSLCVVNETLFYKSFGGEIVAYDGSLPTAVSAALGQEKYKNAVAGSVGDKYYISMQDTANDWHLFVLDTAKALWHREDNLHALYFAKMGEELYAIRADGHLIAMRGSEGTAESDAEWSFSSALLGGAIVNRKYISRINMRMRLPVDSSVDCYVQYDSDGLWRFAGHAEGKGTGTFTLPVRPRRCDHWQFKVEGRGELKMLNMSCIYEIGSDK